MDNTVASTALAAAIALVHANGMTTTSIQDRMPKPDPVKVGLEITDLDKDKFDPNFTPQEVLDYSEEGAKDVSDVVAGASGLGVRASIENGVKSNSDMLKVPVKTVDEYLNAVDYSDDPDYEPSLFALKFVQFIKMVNDGKGEASPTPTFHMKMLDTAANSQKRVANLAARGTAKTSIFAEYLILYIAVYGQIDGFGWVDGIIYVSDTVENGVRSLKQNIQARYEQSDFLKTYLPECTFNQGELWFTNADGNVTGVKMFGANSGIRGVKIKAKRPQLAIFDDLLSDKNAKSDGIIEAINDTISKGANYALDPGHKKVIFSGTPFHQGDPLYRAIESGAWSANVYPIAEKFPCTREEFRGAWPERFTYDNLMEEYNNAKLEGNEAAFYQELMLRITSDEERLLRDDEILWYSKQVLLQQRNQYNFYITTDFATSENRSADPSSISVWAVNSAGHRFWVDGILKRQLMDANIDDLFRLAHQYNPMGVGIETNGQQGGFIPWIRQEMLRRNIYFDLARSVSVNGYQGSGKIGISSPTNKNKLERFLIVLPLIKQGKIWLPEEMKEAPIMIEAVKQLRSVTRRGILAREDDWLDSLSQMGLMEIWTPSEHVHAGAIPLSQTVPEDSVWGRHLAMGESQQNSDPNTGYYV